MGRLKIRAWDPWVFMLIDVAWMIVLALLLGGVAGKWGFLKEIHDPFGGVIPFVVPWAGALGGVAISLVGIADHQLDWNPARYAYWHLARPLLGLIFGTVAVLIIILLLDTVKVSRADQGSYPASGAAVLAVISFVVGYREATFRSLVTRVVDVVLGMRMADSTAMLALVPSALDLSPTTPGGSGRAEAHLFNGSNDTVHVTPASITVDDPSVTVTAFTAQDLKPNESLALELTWTPPANVKTLDATLRIAVANLVVSGRVRATTT